MGANRKSPKQSSTARPFLPIFGPFLPILEWMENECMKYHRIDGDMLVATAKDSLRWSVIKILSKPAPSNFCQDLAIFSSASWQISTGKIGMTSDVCLGYRTLEGRHHGWQRLRPADFSGFFGTAHHDSPEPSWPLVSPIQSGTPRRYHLRFTRNGGSHGLMSFMISVTPPGCRWM